MQKETNIFGSSYFKYNIRKPICDKRATAIQKLACARKRDYLYSVAKFN